MPATAEPVYVSNGGERYHATEDCHALTLGRLLNNWIDEWVPGCRHMPRMHHPVPVAPSAAATDGKRPCLACFPAGAMPYLPMPATETYGHEPIEIQGDQFCARCRTHYIDDDGEPGSYPTLWPCASAVVLGLVPR
ncbi:hypothetical protein Srufu_079050 (plasmid) [Streptomyces libani subsp. rufus]|nr:hypothetical protein Srufu_079050 [Streptomyces libani subsp. rufus]